jgi:hypothetical protein
MKNKGMYAVLVRIINTTLYHKKWPANQSTISIFAAADSTEFSIAQND